MTLLITADLQYPRSNIISWIMVCISAYDEISIELFFLVPYCTYYAHYTRIAISGDIRDASQLEDILNFSTLMIYCSDSSVRILTLKMLCKSVTGFPIIRPTRPIGESTALPFISDLMSPVANVPFTLAVG
ncbi:MAG: hypothetical protein WA364_15125 [Candidatus Nitrosopolaris sp.]